MAAPTCATCLSQDRRLKPSQSFVPAESARLWLSYGIVPESLMCWECEAAMVRFMKFSTQAVRAQALLKEYECSSVNQLPPLQSLSRLSLQPLTHNESLTNCDHSHHHQNFIEITFDVEPFDEKPSIAELNCHKTLAPYFYETEKEVKQEKTYTDLQITVLENNDNDCEEISNSGEITDPQLNDFEERTNSEEITESQPNYFEDKTNSEEITALQLNYFGVNTNSEEIIEPQPDDLEVITYSEELTDPQPNDFEIKTNSEKITEPQLSNSLTEEISEAPILNHDFEEFAKSLNLNDNGEIMIGEDSEDISDISQSSLSLLSDTEEMTLDSGELEILHSYIDKFTKKSASPKPESSIEDSNSREFYETIESVKLNAFKEISKLKNNRELMNVNDSRVISEPQLLNYDSKEISTVTQKKYYPQKLLKLSKLLNNNTGQVSELQIQNQLDNFEDIREKSISKKIKIGEDLSTFIANNSITIQKIRDDDCFNKTIAAKRPWKSCNDKAKVYSKSPRKTPNAASNWKEVRIFQEPITDNSKPMIIISKPQNKYNSNNNTEARVFMKPQNQNESLTEINVSNNSSSEIETSKIPRDAKNDTQNSDSGETLISPEFEQDLQTLNDSSDVVDMDGELQYNFQFTTDVKMEEEPEITSASGFDYENMTFTTDAEICSENHSFQFDTQVIIKAYSDSEIEYENSLDLRTDDASDITLENSVGFLKIGDFRSLAKDPVELFKIDNVRTVNPDLEHYQGYVLKKCFIALTKERYIENMLRQKRGRLNIKNINKNRSINVLNARSSATKTTSANVDLEEVLPPTGIATKNSAMQDWQIIDQEYLDELELNENHSDRSKNDSNLLIELPENLPTKKSKGKSKKGNKAKKKSSNKAVKEKPKIRVIQQRLRQFNHLMEHDYASSTVFICHQRTDAEHKAFRKKSHLKQRYIRREVSFQDMKWNRMMSKKRPEYVSAEFKCYKCVLGWKNYQSYAQHNKTYHYAMGDMDLMCNICESIFEGMKSLSQHYRSHFTVYKCKICTFSDTQLGAIRDHIKKCYAERKLETQPQIPSNNEEKAEKDQEERDQEDEPEDTQKCKTCDATPLTKYIKHHMIIYHGGFDENDK